MLRPYPCSGCGWKHQENMAEEQDSTVQVKDQTVEVPSFKARYDWYQTSSDVYVNILVKDDKREKVDVELRPKNLSVTIKLTTGSDYNLEVDLAHEIVPDTSRHKELRSKIEIKMRKKEGIHWAKLERDENTVDLKPAGSLESSGTTTSVTKYPSSSHHARNWDKLVTDINKEEKEEKPEGDTALNKLFQDIYSGGSDEVKRAMNKSFSESGGTVLSTNWGEVGNKKIDVKTPDGMEYKKYEI